MPNLLVEMQIFLANFLHGLASNHDPPDLYLPKVSFHNPIHEVPPSQLNHLLNATFLNTDAWGIKFQPEFDRTETSELEQNSLK
jgi:hypothetical protein